MVLTSQASLALGYDLGMILRAVDRRVEEFRVAVRRPQDLLVFDLVFEKLRLIPGENPRLERESGGGSARMIVEFPPQSFGEEAFLETSNADAVDGNEVSDDPDYPNKNVPTPGEPVPPLPSSRIRIAGRSRLVYAMPSSQSEFPYTLAAVLEAMRTWPLVLDSSALPDPGLKLARLPSGPFATAELLEAATVWNATAAQIVNGLEARGMKGIGAAIQNSAMRVAERAAAGLAGGDSECLASVLGYTLLDSVDALAAHHAELREGTLREASVAAVSLASASAITALASKADVHLGILDAMPFLPLLLAPHEPARNVTALELPYRLLTSPIESARFSHQDGPVEHGARTELWHTRMTTKANDVGAESGGKIRAIWSPDYPLEEFVSLLDPPNPFRMSVDPLDRKMLVRLMAGWNEKRPGGAKYVPRSSRAERLHLSALGALLDSEGTWTARPQGVDLEQWRHLATLGRDHYVRVVYVGYLYPFGHSASLIKVTERKFESLAGLAGERVAVLRQRFFIVVRERVKSFSGGSHVFKGRNFPFSEIEILTRVTPNLLAPGSGASALVPASGDVVYGGEIVPRMAFWPILSGSMDFNFEIVGTDVGGARVAFALPLLFVGETANDAKDDEIRRAYNSAAVGRRRAYIGGATVTFAPFDPADKGDPRLPTDDVTFEAGDRNQHFPLAPNVYPEIASAHVGIRAVQKLLGQPNAVVEVAYPQVYKQHGFGESDPSQNKGKVFLQLINAVHELRFGGDPGQAKSDALGSLASPQMTIQGLSKVMGPVAAAAPSDPTDAAQIEAALAKVIGDSFDPADFFSGAKILGGVDLGTILDVAATLTGADVPKMVSKELPDRVEARFTWDTEIKKSDPLGLFIPRADASKPQTRLAMQGVVATPIANLGDATFTAEAGLDNFKVNLFGFVIVWFERLSFKAQKGQKPDVAVQLRQGEDAIQFGGPLEFVNKLCNLIPSNGFSDPPALTVTPSGIAARFSLDLPAIEVGVFTLSNVSLGAGFNLPFDSKPASVQFNFSERASPFSLTVSFLGGGGFFLIGVSTRGVNEIEAALEFGAGAAIDLGVASGSVEIKAGVYFHWLEPVPDQGSVELSGYVRLHGELSILAIISASLTFNLQLSYHKELGSPGKSVVWGEATLVIEVEVLFFSASVEVHCRREFGGSESDPKFIDQIPSPAVWAEYCDAFAVEGA